MKKIFAIMLLCSLLVFCGCRIKQAEAHPEKTYTVSGIVVEKSHLYYTTDLVIELENGMKVSVWERHSSFSAGVEEGDKACFEVKKADGGYRIIGVGFQLDDFGG